MSAPLSHLLAIAVACGGSGLLVRAIERRWPDLRGRLGGLFALLALVGFSLFFRELRLVVAAPLILLAAWDLIRSLRRAPGDGPGPGAG